MNLRFANWIWVVLLLGASAMLYHTSYQVQELQRRIEKLEITRMAEQETIHVLQAEWAYLAAPARVQKLAAKYLPLKTATAAQIIPHKAIAAAIPRREIEQAASFTRPEAPRASLFKGEQRLYVASGGR